MGELEGNGEILEFRRVVEGAERIVALTGAGVSTESGIPDFRSPGGLYGRGIKPITFQDFVASEEARLEDWRRRFRMNAEFAAARPNAGHMGLARLFEVGKLLGLITQNIDGLHQRAGLPPDRVIEIHGNSSIGRCIECRAPMALDAVGAAIEATGASPRCQCGGLVKAAIVSFGESIPVDALQNSLALAERADLFLAVGSSLQVQPAATLPLVAKRAGATLVIVNRDETPADPFADLIVRGSIGSVFAALYPQLDPQPLKETFSSR